MTFRSFYADFHIHIGRTESGRPVKISGSRNLTFFNIVREAAERKGMDMIRLIDSTCRKCLLKCADICKTAYCKNNGWD